MQSYGGDAKIIATIQELERVSAKISNAAAVLPRQLSLGLALAQPVAVAYFVASISGISSRLERLAANCQEASAAYFSTEAQIAARFASGLPEVLERHPWLAEFYRPALVGQALTLGLALCAGGAASSFTGSAATRGVRYLADLSPQLLGPLFGQPHGASREAAANLLASTARTGLLTETPVLARPVTPLIMPQSPGVRGLAERDFERRFQLADYVVVKGAELNHGLLSITLERELPEALKPRRIEIATGTPLIEGRKGKAA